MSRALGLLAVLALLGAPRLASAKASSENLDGHFGLGFQVGSPFAISGKYWLSRDTALQGYVGTFGNNFNAVGLDWVYQFARVRPSGGGVHFGFHVGVGGILGFGDGDCFDSFGDHRCNDGDDDELALGVRVPVAANLYFDKVPIEVFLELSPVFQIVPDFDGDLLLGLGGRFYF